MPGGAVPSLLLLRLRSVSAPLPRVPSSPWPVPPLLRTWFSLEPAPTPSAPWSSHTVSKGGGERERERERGGG